MMRILRLVRSIFTKTPKAPILSVPWTMSLLDATYT
jgi:hypothetical protein